MSRLHADKGDDRRDWLCESDPIDLADALLSTEARIDEAVGVMRSAWSGSDLRTKAILNAAVRALGGA